jgi:hypothetical protein
MRLEVYGQNEDESGKVILQLKQLYEDIMIHAVESTGTRVGFSSIAYINSEGSLEPAGMISRKLCFQPDSNGRALVEDT